MDDGLPQLNVKPDRASEEEEFGNLRQTHRQQMERLVEIEKESSALYQALDEVREVHRQAPRKESGGGRVPEVRTLPIQEERVREERTQIKRALRTLEEEKDEVQKILDDCSKSFRSGVQGGIVTRSRGQQKSGGRQSCVRPLVSYVNRVDSTYSSPSLTDEVLVEKYKAVWYQNEVITFYAIPREASRKGSSHIADLVGAQCQCGVDLAMRLVMAPRTPNFHRLIANCKMGNCDTLRWVDQLYRRGVPLILKLTDNPNTDEYFQMGMDWILKHQKHCPAS